MDSHKNIVTSLNVVVNHVAKYASPEDSDAADCLLKRLASANSRWESVCRSATLAQGKLQIALMQVISAS